MLNGDSSITGKDDAQQRPQQDEEQTHSMESLLSGEGGYGYRTLKRGDVVDGVVVRVSGEEVLVDVGSKSEGVVPPHELETTEGGARVQLEVGDPVLVYVVQPENREGNLVLSLSRAKAERDWREAQRRMDEGEVFEGEVSGYNRGGLVVSLGEVRGFVPGSQIASVVTTPSQTQEEREAAFGDLVGKRIRLKVIEVNRRHNRLILSERAAMQVWREGQKDRLLDELSEGETRHGRVSSVCSFGVFIDLGGAEGLIHISELSWGRPDVVKGNLKVGDELEVYVLGVDRERKRIALSLKRLEQQPWDKVLRTYTVGQLIEGIVTKLATFGAFVELEEGIEGLVHVSELSDEHVAHPSNVVREGQRLTFRIIRIEPERHRLGLSLRQVSDSAWTGEPAAEQQPEVKEEPAAELSFEEPMTAMRKALESAGLGSSGALRSDDSGAGNGRE